MALGTPQPTTADKTPTGIKSQLDSIHTRLSIHDGEITTHRDLLNEIENVFKKLVTDRLDALESTVADLDDYLHN